MCHPHHWRTAPDVDTSHAEPGTDSDFYRRGPSQSVCHSPQMLQSNTYSDFYRLKLTATCFTFTFFIHIHEPTTIIIIMKETDRERERENEREREREREREV